VSENTKKTKLLEYFASIPSHMSIISCLGKQDTAKFDLHTLVRNQQARRKGTASFSSVTTVLNILLIDFSNFMSLSS
jgi:hypothetical protein